jgi:hypothetical protein
MIAPFFVQEYVYGPPPLAVVQNVCVDPAHTEAGGGVDVNVVGLTLTDRQQVLVARPLLITTFTTNRPGFKPGTMHTVG